MLYGIDLARRDMARTSQAVVVEGYTDVMACHLSGVPTAVATCGTAFGDDHARVLRRFLHDHEEFRGEVIFTFDGDAAGQKAALRAFDGDQNFVSQTYVAVEPTGLDPCDLRIQQGDAAVRELVARRVPLYRFVLEQRRRQVRPRPGRRPGRRRPRGGAAGVLDPRQVQGRRVRPRARRAWSASTSSRRATEVREGRRRPRRPRRAAAVRGRRARAAPPARARSCPTCATRGSPSSARRSSSSLQHPAAVGRTAADVGANDFTHPTYRAVWELVAQAGGPAAADAGWAGRICATCRRPGRRRRRSARSRRAGADRQGARRRLRGRTRLPAAGADRERRIAEVKSRLQRTNPVEQTAEYNRMFGELVALEQHRRTLRDLAHGHGS